MSKDVIFLIASSRRPGNTWALLEHVNFHHRFKVIDLSALNISYFDYAHDNRDDDFIPTVEEIVQYKTIGFVSPVYWYTVSAQMKTFIDRISDLLSERKDLGLALAGKRTFLVASGGTDAQLPQGMEEMLKLTSEYMNMKFLGSFYGKATDDRFEQSTRASARDFLNRIIEV